MHRRMLMMGAVGSAAIALSALLWAADVSPDRGVDALPERPIQGLSLPSEDVTLKFAQMGLISQLLVKEGDEVKAGQKIAQLDDSEEQVQLELDKEAAADAIVERDVEKAILAQDKNTLHDYQTSGASPIEINDQVQKVTVDQARVDLAIGKEGEARTKVKQTEAHLKKMILPSPIDGVVWLKLLNEGEVADAANTPVVRIIQVDPMWVEAQVPTGQARKLKEGDAAYVTLSDKDHKVPPGKILLISPMANSANGMIMVRIVVPNPEKLQPGENVTVKFGGESAVGVASP